MKLTSESHDELTWGDSKVWKITTAEEGVVHAFADKFPTITNGEVIDVSVSEKNGKKYAQPEKKAWSGKGGGGGRSGWRPLTHDEQLAIESAKSASFAVSYWKDIIVALINNGRSMGEALAETKKFPEALTHKMKELSK